MSFYDSDLEGKVGEQLLIDYFNHNNIKFYDVREEPIAQWLDIDFVVPKGNHDKLEILNEVRNGNPNKRLLRQKELGYTIEVKLDKVTHNRYIKKNGELSNGTGNNNSQNIFLKPTKNVKEKNELVEENILNILHPVENLIQVDGAVKDFTNNVIQFFPNNLKL